MNRFLFLLLLMGFGFGTPAVKADPVNQDTTVPANKGRGMPKDMPVGDFDSPSQIRDFRQQPSTISVKGKVHYTPDDVPPVKDGKVGQSLNVKAKGKLIQKTPLRIRGCDHYTVGDFGPLPTNSYKPKNRDDGTVPPHASDFSTVPIESGPDTRKAK